MENGNRKPGKKEMVWIGALVVVCTLMVLSVFIIAAKTAVKNNAKKASQGEENLQAAQAEPKNETAEKSDSNKPDDDFFEELLEEMERQSTEETEEPETEEETLKEDLKEEDAEIETEETEEIKKEEKGEKAEEKTTEEILAEMSIEEKAAQMFMITPEALTGYGTVTEAGTSTYEALEKYPVGGLIYFSQNFVDPEQTKEMTETVQKFAMEISGVPLFLGTDEEGGEVVRIGDKSAFGVEKVSDMKTIGETGDAKEAYEAGKTLGSYLYKNGLNVDFAPVADVLTNSGSQVIGSRSFGSDPSLVASMCTAVVDGLKEEHVLGCMKHFPGHGGVAGDTHAGAVSTDKFLDDLEKTELVPFQAGVDSRVPFIMVSHISAHNVTGEEIPASLSKILITDVLREKMGFQGIVITDAMNMAAITNTYDSGEAAVLAIEAGADMILMPQDFKEAYQGVLDAIETGRLSEGKIDDAVERILSQKLEME